MPVTGCSVWITAPSSRARAAMAVVARYGSAKPSRGEYVAETRSSVRRYGQPARTSSGSSTRVSTPRLRWSSALLRRLLQDEIAMLPELWIDAELRLEVLVDLDALLGQLDADAMSVLVTHAAAGQRGGAGADAVTLQHHHPAVFAPRQVIRRRGAHDAGSDDDRVRSLGH